MSENNQINMAGSDNIMDFKVIKNEEDEVEIDLVELILYMLHKWYFLVIGMLIGGILAGIFTYTRPLQYKSESMIFVLSETTTITSLTDLQIGSELSEDFLVISESKPVLDTGIEYIYEEMGVTLTRDDVLDMLEVSADSDRILTISVESDDPLLACNLANAITDAICLQIAEIMKSDPPTVIEVAEVEDAEDRGMLKNMVIGALVGFVLVACIVLIPHLLDNKIKTPEDVENYLGMTPLGVIPLDKSLTYRERKKSPKKTRDETAQE